MNAEPQGIMQVIRRHGGKLVLGAVLALPLGAMLAGLVQVSGATAQAGPASAAAAAPAAAPAWHYPSTLELKPAANEAPVFEY